MNRWLIYSVKLETYLGVGTNGPTKEIPEAGRFTASAVLASTDAYRGNAFALLAPEFYPSGNFANPCHRHTGTATVH